MQFHQEMRADRDVEGFGEVRHLEPWGNAADAADIDLDDRAGVALEIFAEMQVRVEAFAHRDGDRRVLHQPRMARNVVGGQRLLEPADIERFIGAGPADRLVDIEALVGVGEDFEPRPDRFTHRRDAAHILVDRPTDFQLAAAEAVGLGAERVLDQRRLFEMQPAALGGVERNFFLCPAGEEMQRHPEFSRLQIPECRVDGGECDRGDGADCGGVGEKEQVAPDRLDFKRLAADQRRHQRALQQFDHRMTAGADGVAVAGAGDPIAVGDADDGGFLGDEGLDGVDPLHLRLEVDHQHFDPRNPRHGKLPLVPPSPRRRFV